MVERSGLIVLDHRVEAIQVGHRHRRDLGDLTELVDSIRDMGMLQPITISPDGVLICGARRLAAAKQLGLRQINVWIRADISTPLQHLLAEQHDNMIRKPFSPAEAADMYTELKTLLAEEATRRQQATQFGADIGVLPGAAESAAPADRTPRAQAARLVTGQRSYTRLEQVVELKRTAGDRDVAGVLRQAAFVALADIDINGKVNGPYQRFKTTQGAIGRTPLSTGQAGSKDHTEQIGPISDAATGSTHDPATIEKRRRRNRVRAFLLVLNRLSGWTTGHDPCVIGPALSQEQWVDLQIAATTTVEFVNAVRHARLP